MPPLNSAPLLALLSALLFGASTPFANLLLGEGLGPFLLAGLLYLGSGIGLAAFSLARRATGGGGNEAPLRRADLPRLALLVFFVFALQCTSTIVVMARETGSWKWPALAFSYMLALAWVGSFVTYHASRALLGS